MNEFEAIDVDYLRPSRTIETVLVTNKNIKKVFFVYNYEGYSFRVFENHLDLINFFQESAESDYHFDTEEELDHFLRSIS